MKVYAYILIFTLTGCDFVQKINAKAKTLNGHKKVAINLSRENRLLKTKISELKYKIQALETKNKFIDLKLEEMKKSAQKNQINKVDYVEYDTYNWSIEKLLTIAESEFNRNNYLKASQFFNTIIQKEPYNKVIDDQFLFQAGVSNYESGRYYNQGLGYMKRLIKNYPNSPYYRGAKLWSALTYIKLGKNDEFQKILEEFRLKYRNTPEWNILGRHYAKFKNKIR